MNYKLFYLFIFCIITLESQANITNKSIYESNIPRNRYGNIFKKCRKCGVIIAVTQDVCNECQALEKCPLPHNYLNLGKRMVDNGNKSGWIYIFMGIGGMYYMINQDKIKYKVKNTMKSIYNKIQKSISK